MIIRLNETAYDEGVLEDNNIEFAVYDYTNEGYEGYGNCLASKGNSWYTHNLGHCSCYGPFEEFDLKQPFNSLEEAIATLHNDDYSKSFDGAIKRMYEEAVKWTDEMRYIYQHKTSIKCPKCSRTLYTNNMTLLSDPPLINVRCKRCGYNGSKAI